MKTFFQIALCLGLLIGSNAYAQDDVDESNDSYADTEVPADHPVEGHDKNGWKLWAHYEPCHYTKDCCIDQVYSCDKIRCCYVKKYYDVERCRFAPVFYTDVICRCGKTYELDRCYYVPKYYSERICRREPHYYREPGWKIRKVAVRQDCCELMQYFYWKRDCEIQPCDA